MPSSERLVQRHRRSQTQWRWRPSCLQRRRPATAPPATDIELPQADHAPYVVWLDDDAETEVYLQGDGTVLATRSGASGLTRWLFRLHTGDIFGASGVWISLLFATFLCTLITSGLAMVWSRRRKKSPSSNTAGPANPWVARSDHDAK